MSLSILDFDNTLCRINPRYDNVTLIPLVLQLGLRIGPIQRMGANEFLQPIQPYRSAIPIWPCVNNKQNIWCNIKYLKKCVVSISHITLFLFIFSVDIKILNIRELIESYKRTCVLDTRIHGKCTGMGNTF
jgi:hypothetical protein